MKEKKSKYEKFVDGAKSLTKIIRSDKTAYKNKVLSEKNQTPKSLDTDKKPLMNKVNMDELLAKFIPKEKLDGVLNKINELKNKK